MAGYYRRTISFPTPKTSASANGKLAAAYRVRSASLPCRFHPLVLQLDDDVAALRLVIGHRLPSSSSSSSSTAAPSSASSVSAAASQVVRVLASLSELLHHPLAQEPLRRLGASSPFAERLLDDYLRLADAHGSFRESLVALAALQAETRAALRRGDRARIASAARAQRRAGRDLPRLASAARAVAARAPVALPQDLQPETAALAAAVADSTIAVASASAAVFSGVSALSNAAAAARVDVASTHCWLTAPSRFIAASSDAPRTSRQSIWWVADLVRWMSRAKRRSAGKRSGSSADNGDDSSTVGLRSEGRMKPEEKARKAAFELHENLERCIASVDCSGEKVFRALVNTRVSLLNILSPTF
ncbi:uncharacterized protein LOC100823023 [Brachypodium distachyon]|uniref:Uncharacterized protein n=1 Tax=Brachypodium distachyon TaxID=15368 RepID=I1J0K8_BRADI|nr:uncharacterized protein LOC100823023 [Brachypodium distachyon]KQJ84050.1 hypothetical protein BRADI_5g18350v3 [Brachypodium distachyon]|eukprot:XP_003580327.1 uncharacterized protein LOC100823023 [Brachypodium distachyon]